MLWVRTHADTARVQRGRLVKAAHGYQRFRQPASGSIGTIAKCKPTVGFERESSEEWQTQRRPAVGHKYLPPFNTAVVCMRPENSRQIQGETH